jgi:hypothetical protein
VSALALSACGDDDDGDTSTGSSSTQTQQGAATTAKRVQQRDCITPSRAAVEALEESLSGGGTLRAARALPSADSFKGPTELRDGAVFIAARLGANGSLIWLTTKEFVDTGEGLAIAASTGTRRVSSLGADEDPDLIGISPESRGLAEVRACVTERLQEAEARARVARERRDEQRARARRAAVRRAQRAARRQREADRRAAPEAPGMEATPEAPSRGTCSDTPQTNFPVPPGDPRDRDGDGIACES